MATEREEGEEFERPSKTQRKKEMLALQDLGEALAALSAEQLATVPISDDLLDAILLYRRITQHGGRRRQMQYIGKLMRGLDAEPIRAAVEAIHHRRDAEAVALHEAERWRERLLEGDEAISAWLAAHPQGDAPKLRSLVRNARTAGEEQRRKAMRLLFRFLRESS